MTKEQFSKHLIDKDSDIRSALKKLNDLPNDNILFVVDKQNRLIGSLTDGDLRRGFIKGLGFENNIMEFVEEHPASVNENEYSIEKLEYYKSKNFRIIPVVNKEGIVTSIVNFRTQSTIIPADAVLMAGGEGKRLRPLTANTPKPLLKVGEKPIIEYNIDRLINVGIKKITLSINYLGEQLVSYFGDGSDKNISITYVKEEQPLGTIGSLNLIEDFHFGDVIVMNSDLLTNIDFTDFFKTYKDSGADMAVATTSYHVNVPYAVLEVGLKNNVKSLKEKPKYTYFSNAGIYIIKASMLEIIPKNEFFNVTDLMEKIIALDRKLITYPINGYWLDIGKHDDFEKAQEDIKHLKL